jgi:hypothetical protein
MLLRKPFYTISSIILIKIVVPFLKREPGAWEIAPSTKKIIMDAEF